MITEELILIGLIVVNTIASIIGTLKGNKSISVKAEQQREKAINKLIKKHNKTEEQFLKEEKQINLLKNKEN